MVTGRSKKILLFTGLLALLAQPDVHAASVDFPAPPRARVQWVSSNMVYNGRTMQVRKFESNLPAGRVLEYYRNIWEDGFEGRPGFIESDAMAPWRMISRIGTGQEQ